MSRESREKESDIKTRIKQVTLVVGGSLAITVASVLAIDYLSNKQDKNNTGPESNNTNEKVIMPPRGVDFNGDGIEDKLEIKEITPDFKSLFIKMSKGKTFQYIPLAPIPKDVDKIKVENDQFYSDGKNDVRLTFDVKNPDDKCGLLITTMFRGLGNGFFQPPIINASLKCIQEKPQQESKPGEQKILIPGNPEQI